MVKTVNGITPDENGNVQISVMELSSTEKELMLALFCNAVYGNPDMEETYNRLSNLWSNTSGGENPEPDNPGGDTHTHSYTSSVTVDPTCTTNGVRTHACACGDSFAEEIPATGHNYVDGVCSVCGQAQAPTLLLSDTTCNVTNSFSMTYGGRNVAPGVMMAGFDETTHRTALSGKRVTQVSIKMGTAGTFTIGKCDLTNWGDGTEPRLLDEQVFTATAGMNTFNVDISLGETETLAFHAPTDTSKLLYTSIHMSGDGVKTSEMRFITADGYVDRKEVELCFNGSIYGYE